MHAVTNRIIIPNPIAILNRLTSSPTEILKITSVIQNEKKPAISINKIKKSFRSIY